MSLNETDTTIAAQIYDQLITGLSKEKKGSKRWWELIMIMQDISNKGFLDAKKYMNDIDLSQAPKMVSKTSFTSLLEGPPGTSFKGQRRQLQADPESLHKTFGMRPHHARGDDSSD